MRTSFILVILLSVLMAVPQARAETPLGPDEFSSVDELALAIAAYFPKVKGEVTSVQGTQITVNLGRKDGIVPNMELSLWREGRALLHPVTKAVIGHAEDEVGTIEVTLVSDATSTAVMKRTVLEPRVGDRARITPRKISLAVLPLRNDRPDIIEGLVERLGELGRFSLLDQAKVTAFLKDRKQRDATLVREMGTAFALDAVVAVAILPSDSKYLVTGRIFYADETQPLDTIVATLNLGSKREALGDIRPFFAPLQELKVAGKKTPVLPVDARYFTLADVDGDGKIEYVVSDATKFFVYRLDADSWKELAEEPVATSDRDQQEIAISAADINKNGKAEIFVTRMLDGKVSSRVFELQDGALKQIAAMPGFLRVLNVPGRGLALIGQDYDPATLFTGQPRELVWSGAGYTTDASMAIPKGMNIYSFTLANMGESQPLLVGFDTEDHLMVYTSDTVLWKSEEEYQSAPTMVLKPLTGVDAVLGRAPTDMDRASSTSAALNERFRMVRIPGRILAADLPGKGLDDIIVANNDINSIIGSFKGGEIQGLTWTGARLNPRWNVKDLAGPVLDIQVAKTDDGKYETYALIKKSGGLFKKDNFWIEKFEGK
jgi:hypothetical protein